MSELQTKRSVFMELKDGHPRVDRDKTLNERLPEFEMIRWLIEEKQSATFVMGFGAHAPIETPELATKFGLSTSEVETALRSTLVVFKDEAFDAIRLRGKRHGGPRNTNVSAEFVKLTMLKFLWLEPYLTDYDLTGRLADQDDLGRRIARGKHDRLEERPECFGLRRVFDGLENRIQLRPTPRFISSILRCRRGLDTGTGA